MMSIACLLYFNNGLTLFPIWFFFPIVSRSLFSLSQPLVTQQLFHLRSLPFSLSFSRAFIQSSEHCLLKHNFQLDIAYERLLISRFVPCVIQILFRNNKFHLFRECLQAAPLDVARSTRTLGDICSRMESSSKKLISKTWNRFELSSFFEEPLNLVNFAGASTTNANVNRSTREKARKDSSDIMQINFLTCQFKGARFVNFYYNFSPNNKLTNGKYCAES